MAEVPAQLDKVPSIVPGYIEPSVPKPKQSTIDTIPFPLFVPQGRQASPLSSPTSKDTSSVSSDSDCFDVPPQEALDQEWDSRRHENYDTLVYIFIFVNPLSGGQKGHGLIALPFQQFRLKHLPHIIVMIHNIIDPDDRIKGVQRIAMLQGLHLGSKAGEKKSTSNTQSRISVWSAGGDGTVMSVYELLLAHSIDTNAILFSCIPLGTGNDVSQVLGWGRTIPHKQVVGKHLEYLNRLVMDRILHADVARLDIWHVEMRVDPHTGSIEHVQKGRAKNSTHRLERTMCSYMSLGVQGYVGSGFEKRRTRSRLLNMMVYAMESVKWVFWRRFPPITSFVSSIRKDGVEVLKMPTKPTCTKDHRKEVPPTRASSDTHTQTHRPELTKHPIDLIIQNIPHVWGREIDLWGDASSGLECVQHRQGPTDAQRWHPQRANDGRLEVIAIHSLFSYVKKLVNLRKHVSRIGQFESSFEIAFHPPQSSQRPHTPRTVWERDNRLAIMCDGEFYLLKDPQSIQIRRSAQLWTLGRCDGNHTSRLVLDEQATPPSPS